MTERTFALWVEPIAAKLRESRAQVADLARSIPAEAWSQPSPLPGWTYKDLLAHLAPSEYLNTVLRAVLANELVDVSIFAQVDARNAQQLEERRDRSVEELIAELEAGNSQTQELLSRLAEADESRRQADIPMSLGEGLRGFLEHDPEHLAQLRTALET
jgi:uncharacterized protein (TIGR03083 family)